MLKIFEWDNMYISITINKIENYQGYGCVWLGDYPYGKFWQSVKPTLSFDGY